MRRTAGRRPGSLRAHHSVRPGARSCTIDLELEPGKTVALIGHTGSGKTTLASLVPRFYDVTEGRITIDGADVVT
jgi:ABC-type multidrug transport system fused ATPase/permease subunit